MRNMISKLSLILALLMVSSASFAATINVPADQPTLAAAVAVAVDGDVINITDGSAQAGATITTPGINLTINGTDTGSGQASITSAGILGFGGIEIAAPIGTLAINDLTITGTVFGAAIVAPVTIDANNLTITACVSDGIIIADQAGALNDNVTLNLTNRNGPGFWVHCLS